LHTYVVCPHTQFIKPSAKIPTYDAAYIFEVLKCHEKEPTLYDLVEIQKQSALEEAEELRNLSVSLRRGPLWF
jgi:hypothetical protein